MEDEDFSNIDQLLSFSHGVEGSQQWMDQVQQAAAAPTAATSAAAALPQKISQLQSLLLQIASRDSSAVELLVDQLLLATKSVMLNSSLATPPVGIEQPASSSSDDPFVSEELCFDLGSYFAYPKAENEDPIIISDQHQQQEFQLHQQLQGNVAKEEDEEAEAMLEAGSYDLIELDAMEILAEHTHFCEICGKGFKRDANLRMHMRGHGDEYKTAAALARPQPEDPAAERPAYERKRRYSCPDQGCRRNRRHLKFLPLKTLLCVKNHYRRSHCPKVLTCTKCNAKRFSVTADLRTHEKHCGQEKWQCSCGTTFSRKDKLAGHLQLFVGHKPASPPMVSPSFQQSPQQWIFADSIAIASQSPSSGDWHAP